MRLSEAIRLGSMLGPQAYRVLTQTKRKYIFFGPIVNEYCALGAAFAASGAPTTWHVHQEAGEDSGAFRGRRGKHKAGASYRVVEHQWITLMWSLVDCPTCNKRVNDPLHRIIPHLNDQHRWTREQIADWVETVELRETTNSLTSTDDVRGTTALESSVVSTRD